VNSLRNKASIQIVLEGINSRRESGVNRCGQNPDCKGKTTERSYVIITPSTLTRCQLALAGQVF